MGGSAKIIMGATLIMVVTLAMVLGLVFVLLAELYCSLLLRRRRHQREAEFATAPPSEAASSNNSTATEPRQQADQSGYAPSLSSFYSQGVLQAPRNFLFPSFSIMDNRMQDLEKQNFQPQNFSPHVRLAFSSPSSPTSFTPLGSPKTVHEIPVQYCSTSTNNKDNFSKEQLVYICNPIYDNEGYEARHIRELETPFETPDTSPSRLEDEDEDEDGISVHQSSPPLTPMKRLPTELSSISLKNVKSLLGASGSDYSNSNNNDCPSSSSSASPRTSPSW